MAKGQKPAPIANTANIEARINQCLEWIDDGWTHRQAVRQGSAMWGISTRQVEKYWGETMRIVVAQFEKDRPTLAANIVKKLDNLYERCVTGVEMGVNEHGDPILRQDMTNARQSLMDKAKLCGLLKDQVEINDIKAPDLSNADPKKIREKLRKS